MWHWYVFTNFFASESQMCLVDLIRHIISKANQITDAQNKRLINRKIVEQALTVRFKAAKSRIV